VKNILNKRVMQAGALAGSSWNCTGNFAVPSGTHTLKWKYYKYSGSTAGSCWIDAIQWSGGVPASGGGADWEQITYTYDPSGRRIAKDVDGEVTKYVYDGDHCIAEYDGSNNLLRKYIHGPSIDEPICMIESAGGYAGTYYYHFDALGSVVALSDADGDTVQVYEYDVYGQVAASDPNHPNRFMFTGREFDTETGLYYYRARYYNASIGRFLQTDPIGYDGGIDWYTYCRNNPCTLIDPTGCIPIYYPSDVPGKAYWRREPVGSNLYPEIGSSHANAGAQIIGPYFAQPTSMSCVAAAIMNVCVTMGTIPIDFVPEGGKHDRPFIECNRTDKQAVHWVCDQLDDTPGLGDRDDWGYNLVQASLVLPDSVVIADATQTTGLSGIVTQVDQGNAVIVGIDLSGGEGDPQWHAVAIVPTPPTLRAYLMEEFGYDKPYMVANGFDLGGHGYYFDANDLPKYLASFGVYDDWLVASPPK
jgi:RHS repeat-associated protein